MGSPGGSNGKESAHNATDPGWIAELGRSPGEGNGNPLQYSYLENPMDWGVWWVRVHGVTKSWTRLSDFHWRLSGKKNSPANAGDLGHTGLIPELGRSPGEGNGNPLQCSCLENPMDREAWQAITHGVRKSRTQLSNWTHIHFTKYITHTKKQLCCV